MNSSEATALRAAVRRIDKEVSKWLSGLALSSLALALVQAPCEDFRAFELDERSAYFVGVMERSVARIHQAQEGLGTTATASDLATAEIELMKSVWNLDAHLLVAAASAGKHATNCEASDA